jgi:hypothetical protein
MGIAAVRIDEDGTGPNTGTVCADAGGVGRFGNAGC